MQCGIWECIFIDGAGSDGGDVVAEDVKFDDGRIHGASAREIALPPVWRVG